MNSNGPIVLATANARYSHCSLALRSLRANLGRHREHSVLREYVLSERSDRVVEDILNLDPGLVGLSVSIWNSELMGQVVELFKYVRPDLPLVLGGPELADSHDLPEYTDLADALVVGEGEESFLRLVEAWSQTGKIEERIWLSPKLDLANLCLPDAEYSDEDIAHRVLYVESSRGCPFKCAFCLSAREPKVRRFPLPTVLASLERLWDRGARRFKFVDRSLQAGDSDGVIDFFLARTEDPELFVHFEYTPQGLSDALLARLSRFPAGSLQLELGVQSFDPQVAERIGRSVKADRVESIIRKLGRETSAHLHTDLVAGLPGQDLASIRDSFDRLLALAPDEIQLGILKRLRGAPIVELGADWGMVYRTQPPYDVIQTGALDFHTVQSLKRFAFLFDRVFNSGNFRSSAKILLSGPSPFDSFCDFSSWFLTQADSFWSLSLTRLSQAVFDYLSQVSGLEPEAAADSLVADFEQAGRSRGLPDGVRRLASVSLSNGPRQKKSPLGNADRQARHRKE